MTSTISSQTEKTLEGCNNWFMYAEHRCGYKYPSGIINYCPSCKSKMKGRLEAQDEMCSFLYEIRKMLPVGEEQPYEEITNKMIELTLDINKLREALK